MKKYFYCIFKPAKIKKLLVEGFKFYVDLATLIKSCFMKIFIFMNEKSSKPVIYVANFSFSSKYLF